MCLLLQVHVILHAKHNITLIFVRNCTYAMARGPESYEFLRDCFALVWMDVTALIRNQVVAVEGDQYDLRVVCGLTTK